MRFPLRLKAIVLITLIAVLTSVVISFISYYEFSRTNEANYKEEALDLAYTSALLVDADALKVVADRAVEIFSTIPADEIVTSDDWGSPEFEAYLENYKEICDMPEFKTVHEQLSQIQQKDIATLSSIYTIIYAMGNDGVVYCVYLVDAEPEDPCLPGVLDHVEGADFSGYYDNSEIVEPYVTHTDMYGWLVTTGVPLIDSSGDFSGYLTIDLSMDAIKAKEKHFMMNIIILMIFVIIGLCFVSVMVMNVYVVNPIKTLSQTAYSYIRDKDKGASFATLKIDQHDEIGDLHASFKQMEQDLNEHIRDLMEVTSEKERMETELNVAAKIQMDMLPTDFPDNDRVGVSAFIKPAKDVGGDFYDFFNIDDDRIAFVIADVSGKGIPAALFMVIAKNTIYNRSLRGDAPSRILTDVNNRLCMNNDQALFVTAWLGILTLSTGELVMVNAGHENPAIRHRDGSFEAYVSEHGLPLGAVSGIEYEDEVVRLNSGDMLFVYTDGVTEAKNHDGVRFGEERLIRILNTADTNMETCGELISVVTDQIKDFIKSEDQFDDITMMAIRYK